MFKMKRRSALLIQASVLAGAVAFTGWASAQTPAPYPSAGPITLVVPFAAGSGTDAVARVVATKLGERLKQTVVVDNRAGASAQIGAQFAAKAKPDGYTLFMTTNTSHSANPWLFKSLKYDPVKDFTPIARVGELPFALVVNPKMPVNTVAEFVQHAKAQKGKLSYGSAGNGNVTHLAAFQVVQHFGIEATHVPYKGSAPADVDLVAGQIDFLTDTINSVSAFIKDGKLKLLAVSTPKRLANFPQAPTLAESGMPGYESGAWQGVMVPAKTPKEIVDRLNAAFNKALKDPEVLKKLAIQSTEPLGSTPAEYGAYIKKEIARWDSVVKSTGVSLD